MSLRLPIADFEAHNEEVRQVWKAYHERNPIRVPMIIGINPIDTMWRREFNPEGIDFRRYFSDPDAMMRRQIEHQNFVRHYITQDAEMGPPKEGWHVWVDFQNVYEAAWFGCQIRFYSDQVPDVLPLLADDSRKRMIFDIGPPDPFTGGLMRRNWEFYDHFMQKVKEGYTYLGKPVVGATPCGLGTDGPVTVACNLRGATNFMMDLAVDTDYALELLDLITTAIIDRIRAYRRHLGMEIKPKSWGFADDSIQLISPKMYRDLILPFHRRLVEELSGGGPISMHLCGNVGHHLKFIHKNLNVWGFDTGFPIDLGEMRRQLGPDVELLGGPSVPFLEMASPEEVRSEVRRILRSGVMEGGRFILREGNNLSPAVPLENVWAMYEAVREFGAYR